MNRTLWSVCFLALLQLIYTYNFDLNEVPNIKYELWQRKSEQQPEITNLSWQNPQIPSYNGNDVVILLQGYNETDIPTWYWDYTVMMISKKHYVIQTFRDIEGNYAIAAKRTKIQGFAMGQFIHNLVTKAGVPIDNIRLIGFCLGAHVAGIAGFMLQQAWKLELPTIIGLDPVAPMFDDMTHEWRLSPDDAKTVSVIHTSAGTFGFIDRIGTIDFYPFGGDFQPQCGQYLHPEVFYWENYLHTTSPDQEASFRALLCTHSESKNYFLQSWFKPNFGEQCPNYGQYLSGLCRDNLKENIGEFEYGANGKFYLTEVPQYN